MLCIEGGLSPSVPRELASGVTLSVRSENHIQLTCYFSRCDRFGESLGPELRPNRFGDRLGESSGPGLAGLASRGGGPLRKVSKIARRTSRLVFGLRRAAPWTQIVSGTATRRAFPRQANVWMRFAFHEATGTACQVLRVLQVEQATGALPDCGAAQGYLELFVNGAQLEVSTQLVNFKPSFRSNSVPGEVSVCRNRSEQQRV